MYMFSGDDVLIGHKAVLQSDHNPTNTLYDAKRFIGKQFTSDELNSESSHYLFKVNILSHYVRQHISYSTYMPSQFRLSVCHTGGSVKSV